MNFIHCFDSELKSKLLQMGFQLLSENSSFSIFENNQNINFEFSEIDKKQFILTNKMTF